MYRHIQAKPQPIKVQSINSRRGNKPNDLEAALLAFQKLIEDKVKSGKKGIILNKETDSEYKMSYKKLQGLLWEMHSFFGMRGAFSFGICANCENFGNSCSADGTFGKCNGNDRVMFDSCENHKGESGFGKRD